MELQYDGTGLHGWAKQEGLPTVESYLTTALTTLLDYAPALRVAGRTDAGVHARRQVVSLRLPTEVDPTRIVRSVNALTPAGIAVTRLVPASMTFDARKDALTRTYRYFLTNDEVVSPFWTPFCWHVYGRLNMQILRAAAAMVPGRHDFTAFTPTETEHIFLERSVFRCAWGRVRGGLPTGLQSSGARRGESWADPATGASAVVDRFDQTQGVVYLEIEAEAFLRHMVRTLVGTMVEMTQTEQAFEKMERLLRGASREEAGATAPARGLFLWDVRYKAARKD